MERNERRRADALDRYWDDVLLGEQTSQPADVDERFVAVIRKLSEPRISSDVDAIHQRLRPLIGAPATKMENSTQVLTLPQRTMPQRGRLSLLPAGARVLGRRNATLLAAAAVLLLSIGAGYLYLDSRGSDEPRAIPAAVVPQSTPSPVVTATTLFEVTIPAEELPPGEFGGAGIAHSTISDGNDSSWEPYCCPGPLIEYIVSGLYTVQFEDEIQVVRADGSVEDIPANVETTLGVGDALIARNEVALEAANYGTAPVDILGWVLIHDPDNQFSGHRLSGWAQFSSDVQGVTMRTGPATVRLQLVTLPPGSTLSPPPGTYYFVIKMPENPAGTPQPGRGYVRTDDGPVENNGDSDVTIYVLTLEQAGTARGSPVSGTPSS